jgi:cyclophilin family peptidyl-prolyl cis-trans isomerase
LRIEPLEDRRLLSVATTVGIGAPVLAVFNDSIATAATTFSAKSTNPDVTVTVLHTSEELKMKVHTVNADGTTTPGEMDFLLLDDYAPNNIAHITSLANGGFYNGLTFNQILQDILIQGGDPTGTGNGGSGPNHTLAEHDDEFNVDVRFTSPGLLALANNGPYDPMFPGSRPDTNDCQFFVTSAPYRDGDFQYTIIGKLVADDGILQAVENVPVQDNGSGEISKPVNPPIIDSVSVVPDTQYGLVMLKAGSAATAGETASVSVTASDASPVTLTAADGSSQSAINVVLAQDTPSLNDRPAFIENVPDVYTSVNTPVTVSVPVAEGDAGVGLSYGAQSLPAGNPDLQATASGTGPTDGSMTVTPGATPGVDSVLVGVWRNSTQSSANTAPDLQTVAVFVRPAAPTASLSVTMPQGATTISDHPIFHVTGVSNGMNVGIFVDNNPDPIGTAVVTGTSVDVRTTTTLPNGSHTFSVRQSISYPDTSVGNRDIPAGTLYSDPSANTVTATVDMPPTASLNPSSLALTSSTITFQVVYSSPNDVILLSTIDDNDVRVTGPSGFDRPAALVSAAPNADGSVVTATYQVDTSGSTWDITKNATYTIVVQDQQVSDSHNNYVAAGTLLTFNSDVTPPVATINLAAGQADPTNAAPINFTVTFSEAVTDFVVEDVAVTSTAGTVTPTLTPVGSDGTTYNVAITGMAHDGTVTIDVPAGKVHDLVGNANGASIDTDNNVTYDITPPTLTINQAAGQTDPTSASPINFTVTFSEAVTDFVAGDVTLTSTAGTVTAAVTPVGSGGATYNVAVSGMTHDGTVTINVPAGEVHDQAGNPNVAATIIDNSVTYKAASPTVTINQAANQADPTNAATINFTVVFNQPVTGFVTGDVTIGGTAGATTAIVTPVGSGGATYNVAVSGMTKDGTVTASVPAGVAQGQMNYFNVASTSTDNSVTYDATPPTVTINQAVGQADPTNGTPINFTVVFSEAVAGFAAGDVTIVSTAGATTTIVTPIGSDGTTYNVAVSGMTQNGTITASVAQGVVDDLAGNPNVASTSTDNTVTFDNTAPTVTIDLAAGQADPTNASTINFTVVFSEPVLGFTASKVAISGTAGAKTAVVTPVGSDGTTYNVAVSGMTQDGTVVINMASGAAHDQAGNLSAAPTVIDNSVSYDASQPTVTVNQATGQADPTNASPIDFTVVFSKPVSGFGTGDVTIGGTAGATIATVTPTGTAGTTYNVAVAGMTQSGTVTLAVPAGVVHDQVGNLNVASTSTDNTVNYDVTPPSVTINQAASQADPTNAATIDFTVVFSEAVTGFVTGDVLIGGTAGATTATVTPVGSDGATYTVAITGMTQTGTVIVSVPAGVAQDQVGYYNVASTSTDNTVTYDITPPAVTINQAANQPDPAGGSVANFTVVFSKPVTDFIGGDVTITGTAGATTATVTPVGSDGTTYNVAVSGMTQDGTVIATVAAGLAHDAAGNANLASTSTDNSVTMYITQPTVTIDQASYARPTTTSPINFTVVFSEPVSDFTSQDVTITYSRPGTLVAIVTGSGTTYNVAVSGMTGDATVTASIAAGVAHDTYGNANVASTSTTVNGYADNVVEYLIAPDVGSIVVAEAGAVKNGILESNEPLKITWAASSHYGIVSQTMTLDGRTIAPINGPYSGLYYLCPIGTISAGTHTYTIQSTDLRGISTTETGTFNVTAVGPLAITSVVVAEASTPKNGILDPKDSLKITWAASSAAGKIVSQTMTVDGRNIVPINGPYSGLYYLCSIGSWSAGTHSYAIHATDAKGNTANSTGTFTVVAPPTGVYSVVVAEAGTVKNGILESNEPLKITWAASAVTAIASQTITVDSGTITPINGPYSGLYYSCPIGTWAAGTHTYIIHATDTRGVLYSTSGTFVVVSPLTVGASAAPQGSAAVLSDAQLAPIAAEAMQRLEAQLGNQVETAMAGVQIKVANLSPGILGETSGKTIWIDDNAAGYGWFVDPTPGDDAEFADAPGTHTLTALPGTAADQRADLLTTVMHEMGHVLGYQHAADDLMQAVLPLGVRRTLLD